MIELKKRNIFIYNGDHSGASVIDRLINLLHLDGKNFAMVTNKGASSLSGYLNGIHVAKFESNSDDENRRFENVVKDNIFRLDYLLLDVYPPDRYFDTIDWINVPVIFLADCYQDSTTFHINRVPQEYKIYSMYRESKPNLNSKSIIDRNSYTYLMKDVRKNKILNLSSVLEAYKRHKKINILLSKD